MLLTKGAMYQYEGQRQLSELIVFARGGFQETAGEPVPPKDDSLWSKLTELVGG
jgi:hypothetical protein